MAFPTTQDGGPARGCHDRHGWMPRGHCTTSSCAAAGGGRSWPIARTAKASSCASGCPSLTRRGCSGSPRRGLRKRSRERSGGKSTESTTSRILPHRVPGSVMVVGQREYRKFLRNAERRRNPNVPTPGNSPTGCPPRRASPLGHGLGGGLQGEQGSPVGGPVAKYINFGYLSRMPRGPRLDAPGTLHHVMVRGIARAVERAERREVH